jgi:PAS domain S-box-containing protein
MSDQIRIILLGLAGAAVILAAFITKTLVLFHFLDHNYYLDLFEYFSIIIFIPIFSYISYRVIEYQRKQAGRKKTLELLLEESALVSRADAKGKITYVNDKFCEVSGYKRQELIGKDHVILNSGNHSREFWNSMYKTVVKDKGIWNEIVTNRDKNGNLYYVNSWISGEFDSLGNLTGYISIRQDISEITKVQEKLKNLLSTQTSYVLRTDMLGKHTYWNEKFEEDFGWVYEESGIMHSDALMSICSHHHSRTNEVVYECIKNPGKIVKVELDKPTKNTKEIKTTLWEFICVTDSEGNPLEIQCMGIDITDRKKAEEELKNALEEVQKKNTYLEHAAKILRHDMHSGINTYIPRGVSSLKRRLNKEIIGKLKLDAPLRMITDGLEHTQKVYRGVYEFTNLVKKDSILYKESYNLKDLLESYLSKTAYSSQVKIDALPTVDVNGPLFCTAVDNLIRNGLKYNDSDSKIVSISMCDEFILCVQDNGRGMTNEEFLELSKPYTRKERQAEQGTGLGLNICVAILKEHGFSVSSEKNKIGTRILINMR